MLGCKLIRAVSSRIEECRRALAKVATTSALLVVGFSEPVIKLLRARRLRRSINLRQIHLLPLAGHDPRANFGRSFPELRLLVAVHGFLFAHVADGAVVVSKAIEQARVTHFPVATAIARLLIKHRLHFRGQCVDFLGARVGKLLRIKRLGQSSGRRAGVIRRSVAVRPRRRRLGSRLRGRYAALPAGESDSEASTSHQNHRSKHQSCPFHLKPPCEPMRISKRFFLVTNRITELAPVRGGTGTLACALTTSPTKFVQRRPRIKSRHKLTTDTTMQAAFLFLLRLTLVPRCLKVSARARFNPAPGAPICLTFQSSIFPHSQMRLQPKNNP